MVTSSASDMIPVNPRRRRSFPSRGSYTPSWSASKVPTSAPHLQQLVPVLARAGQPAHLQPEDQPDPDEGDGGEQPLEPGTGIGPLPLWPWSSSITTTWSADQPRVTA